MITNLNRLIAYQRVNHIPEGRKYTYIDEPYCLEFYMDPFSEFWKPNPMSGIEVSGYLMECDPYKSESLGGGGGIFLIPLNHN